MIIAALWNNQMKKTKQISAYMAAIGRKGGSATGKSKARDPAKMKAAALKRWSRHKSDPTAPGAKDSH